MNSISLLLIFAFIGSVAGLIGGAVLLFNKEWAKALASVSVPLAAGILLALSLLDLLPEAVEEVGETAFSVILVVFVVLFLIERFFFYLHHHQETGILNTYTLLHAYVRNNSIPSHFFLFTALRQ